MVLDGHTQGRQAARCNACRKKTTGKTLMELISTAITAGCTTAARNSPDVPAPLRKRRRGVGLTDTASDQDAMLDQGHPRNFHATQTTRPPHRFAMDDPTKPTQVPLTRLTAVERAVNALTSIPGRLRAIENDVAGLHRRADRADAERTALMESMTNTTQQLLNFMQACGLQPKANNLPIAAPRRDPSARPAQAPTGPDTPHRAVPTDRGGLQNKTAPHPSELPLPSVELTTRGRKIDSRPLAEPYCPPATPPASTPPSRPSWATIAMKPALNMMDSEMQNRLRSAQKGLASSGFAPVQARTVRPKPTAVYFAGVPRGQKGVFRNHLVSEHALPRWALLSISFYGDNMAEILTHRPLENRLIACMRLLGYRHLKTHDPLTSTQKTTSNNPRDNHDPPRTALACANRWTREIASTPSATAREWYTDKLKILLQKHPSLTDRIIQQDRTTPSGAQRGNRTTPTILHKKQNAVRQDEVTDELETQKENDGFQVVINRRRERNSVNNHTGASRATAEKADTVSAPKQTDTPPHNANTRITDNGKPPTQSDKATRPHTPSKTTTLAGPSRPDPVAGKATGLPDPSYPCQPPPLEDVNYIHHTAVAIPRRLSAGSSPARPVQAPTESDETKKNLTDNYDMDVDSPVPPHTQRVRQHPITETDNSGNEAAIRKDPQTPKTTEPANTKTAVNTTQEQPASSEEEPMPEKQSQE